MQKPGRGRNIAAAGRSGWRRVSLAGLSAVVLLCSLAATAWAVGELTQKQGTAGCISESGSGGCRPGIGLDRAAGLATSPDGKSVYVASESGAVAIFNRNPDGTLEQLPGTAGCISRGGIGGCQPGIGLRFARSVGTSADGKSVYVASPVSDAVAIFRRNDDGTLEQPPGQAGCISQAVGEGCRPGIGLNGATSVTTSADGKSVYVASLEASAVAIFNRNPDGTLEQLPGTAGCISRGGVGGCRPGVGLGFADGVATSLDGKSVYVSSGISDAIAIFRRNDDGTLEQPPGQAGCISQAVGEGCRPGIGLNGAISVTTSPDGKSVYAASESAAVAIFNPNPDGSLVQPSGTAGCISEGGVEGCQPGIGLRSARSVATSADGKNVYVASAESDAVAIFNRNPDGTLEQPPGAAGCISQDGSGGCRLGIGLDGAGGIATSPDGKSVYVASPDTDAVAIFDRAVPAPPPVSPDTSAPTVSGFKLAPKRFKAAPTGSSSFRFALSEPAGVKIQIERARPGRKVGKRCKKPTPKLAERPRCKRFTGAGERGFQGRSAGVNKIAFNGKVSGRALKPGSYRATIRATDAVGNRSAPKRASFTVLAAKPRKRDAR